MMNRPQVIVDDSGRPTFAVIPWSEYERLAAIQEDAEDAAACDRAKEQEAFPAEVVDRMLAGEHPIGVFRSYRGMTQKQLAEAVGITPLYLSQIERGTRTGSVATLKAIANALHVELDDLL